MSITNPSTAIANERFLRLPEVLRLSGKSRTALYQAVKRGEFPPQVRIGARQVAWPISSIETWQGACVEASKSPQA